MSNSQAELARRALGLIVVAIVAAIATAVPASAQVSETPTTTIVPVPVENDSPGLFDLSGRIGSAIDDWFGGLITSAINPALDLLGKTLLSAPDVTQQGEVRTVWMISLGIADAAFIILALVGGITVMTHETLQTRYSVKEIAPRLVVAVLAANLSLVLTGQAIQLSNGLSQGFLGSGIDPNQAVNGIGRAIVSLSVLNGNGGLFVLLGVVATVMCLILVCLYLIRAVIVVILVAGAPLALACHALPQTERFAMLWWRAVAACLVIQVAQALVLITAVHVFFASNSGTFVGVTAGDGLVSLLITVCLLFVMIKIPGWAERMVFGSGGGPVRNAGSKAVVAARLAVARA